MERQKEGTAAGIAFVPCTHAGSVALRLHPGTDLIESIEEVCDRLKITAGFIALCIGSLRKANVLVVAPAQNRIGAAYTEPIVLEGPLELICAQGSIGLEEDRTPFVHLHGIVSDRNGAVHGGHFVKGACPVLITCEILISRVEGVSLIRDYDREVDMKILRPGKPIHETGQ